MDREAREARERMKQLSKKEQLANFWYYHKVHIFAAIFAVLVVGFGISECVKQVEYDLEISYYSASYVDSEKVENLEKELQKNIEDVNFDAQTVMWIAPCYATLDDATEQTQAVLMKIQVELAAGNSMGYIMDEKFYNLIYEGYGDCFEKVILISDIPKVREMLGIGEDQKVYWLTKALYETEKDDEFKIGVHENALKVQKYFESLEK